MPTSLSLISLLKISLADGDSNERCLFLRGFSLGYSFFPNANFLDNFLNTVAGSRGGRVRMVGAGVSTTRSEIVGEIEDEHDADEALL